LLSSTNNKEKFLKLARKEKEIKEMKDCMLLSIYLDLSINITIYLHIGTFKPTLFTSSSTVRANYRGIYLSIYLIQFYNS
jgi:hypothetical protein